ncbi:T9SS type A sorting domain-containing protein [Geojedonia litorea]|uniref:T9SS type A sorting domain-containing protein n=1 Tax=Geojedonia litorea TaxID=1268269 RepID=A0ABV9N273_9FLAO
MKNSYLLILALFSCVFINAQLLFDEHFNYGDASGDLTLTSSGDWSVLNAVTPKVGYQTSNLSLNNYEYLAKGGAATIAKIDGESVNTGFASVNSGTIYYSVLVNLTDLGNGGIGFFIHLNGSTGIRARLFAIDDGFGKINFGITSQGTPDFITTPYDLNTTYLLVVSYNIATYTSNLYVLSAPLASEPGAPHATQMSGNGPASVSTITIRQSAAGPSGSIDQMRVATTWEDLMQSYFAPALYFPDGPDNETIISIPPETALNAAATFNTPNFSVSNELSACTSNNSQDGYIKWELKDTSDDSLVSSGCIFSSNSGDFSAIPGMTEGNSYSYTVWLVNNAGVALTNPEATYSVIFNVISYNDVSDIAGLRAGTIDENTYYRVTGQVVLSYYNQNENDALYFFQDNSGGIAVTDEDGFMPLITVGDVFETLSGYLKSGANGELMLEITKIERDDPTINNGDITPQQVTLNELYTNYQDYESELVLINDVNFVSPSGDFTINSTYAINDGTRGSNEDLFLADFPQADYITSAYPVPTLPQDLVALVRSKSGAAVTVTARSTSDFALDINDYSSDSFKLYPNPTNKGYVTIGSKHHLPMQVTVVDLMGKQVLSKIVNNNVLNLSELTPGFYLLKISQNNALVTKRIIIE